jgi:hypothetical protein
MTRLLDTVPRLAKLDRRLDEVKINQGVILSELNRERRLTRLSDYEFKVFSQWGEDGIIQHLTRSLEIGHRTFIEFGVEDFFESNCRFLLMKDRWEGFVIDGSEAKIERLRTSYFYWRCPLQAKAAFITRENVCALLEESGFGHEVGILSVDVDGVDYHLLEALEAWKASIVIVEYNSLFGAARQVTVPYYAGFQRAKAHWSNLYYGASLPAFDALLARRGYALVGVNSVGSNAFFVRRELLNDRVQEVSVAASFRESTFREGRTEDGKLTMRYSRDSGAVVGDLPLIDVQTGRTIRVADVLPAG